MFIGLSSFAGTLKPRPSATLFARLLVDLRQQAQHALSDGRRLHFAQLKTQRPDNVALLRLRLTVRRTTSPD